MPEIDFELPGCSFVHRRSQIHLHTDTIVQILCEDDNVGVLVDEFSLQTPFSSWFPRSQNLTWLLRCSFADDIDLNSIGKDVRRVITDHITDAELWKDLGYDAYHTQILSPQDVDPERVMEMELHLKSVSDDNLTAVCPGKVSRKHVQSVQLHLRFTSGPDRNKGCENISAVVGSRNEHLGLNLPPSSTQGPVDYSCPPSDAEAAWRYHHIPPVSGSLDILQPDNVDDSVYPKRMPPGLSLLDEGTFTALLDIGIRSCIVARPTRVAVGVKCLTETNVPRLSDICPSTFTPRYTQRFREQSSLIPTVSKWLSTFSARSAPLDVDGKGNGGHSRTLDIQKELWMTVANGIRDPEGARRLRPLWLSEKSNMSKKVPETASITVLDSMLHEEGLFTESGPRLHIDRSDCEDVDNGALFGVTLNVNTQADYWARYVPTVTSQSINDFEHATVMRASNVDDNGQQPVDINRLSLEADNSAESPLQHPSHADRLVHRNGVSMIMTPDEPMERRCKSEQPATIGGRSWLTQNVIRMHPLRQHEQETGLVEQPDECGKGQDIPLDIDAGWSRDAPSGLLLEEESDSAGLCTYCSPTHSDNSVLDFGEPYLHQNHPGRSHNPDREVFFEDLPAVMSSKLQGSPSNTSLADVLGNDHLLWHMWKRRASVAPRGEEDMLEMKIMYETDPDMKVLSSGWDLSPGDISSSSNGDPMLQHTLDHQQLPRERLTTPITPTSERRSHFTPTRSSSSSSYVGPSDSGSKPQRRGSIMKRFSWGGRQHSSDMAGLDVTNLGGRAMEVKKRKTLDDYEMMDREALNDDSNDMLF